MTNLNEKFRHLIRLDRAVRFVWQAGPKWTLWSLILLFVQGLAPLVTLYLMKLIVDGVTLAMQRPEGGAAFRGVALLIGLAAGVAFLNALLRSLGGFVKEAQSLAVTDHMYEVLQAKSVEVDLYFYENPQYMDTLHRAQQEGPFRPVRIVNGLGRLGLSSVSLIAMAALLFSFHWSIALILFAAAAPGIFVRMRFAGEMFHSQRQLTSAERKSGYLNWILTGHWHAKEIRLFDLGNLFRKRFGDVRAQIRHERLKMSRRRFTLELLPQLFSTLIVFGTLGFIAQKTAAGAITLGGMVMYFQAFRRGLAFIQEMMGSLADLYGDSLFLSNLYDFLNLEPRVKEPEHPVALPRPMAKGVVFERVSFRYPGTDKGILKDVSLSLEPGEVVALVGENGSGKTTLTKLLCRLYDPDEGVITLDGTDIRRFATKALRKELGVIFQDYNQYHLTARENVWVGNTSIPPEHERVEETSRLSGAHETIRRLPRGYETYLGRGIEEGQELSIGEWQKVALARAFLNRAQVIVLDEPTSAMDARSEYELFKGFRERLKGRSAILISHRFSTVRMADRIYVLEAGRITENGSHEQLISSGGKYADLFEKQARHYL